MFGGKKVLLVEDNPADAQLTLLAFKTFSPQTELKIFSNGRHLLKYLDEQIHLDISLILLDLNMPVMNGREILHLLQENHLWSTIPAVVFSSSKHRDDVEECYSLGAKAYVAKPFDLQEFEKTIAAIAGFWFRVQPNSIFSAGNLS
ncbi:MAG: response regulator [Saprospiraceae bacterium]